MVSRDYIGEDLRCSGPILDIDLWQIKKISENKKLGIVYNRT